MAINKLIGKRFKFMGLKVTGLTFRKGQQLLKKHFLTAGSRASEV